MKTNNFDTQASQDNAEVQEVTALTPFPPKEITLRGVANWVVRVCAKEGTVRK
jgi:hypothetical protein